MEVMETIDMQHSPDQDVNHLHSVFQTVRMETDTLPPLVDLGRKLLTRAQEGDAEGVKDLMQQGAPFTSDWLGTSALHWACQLNHIEVAELLLKAGISRDARNKVDRTPLHCTAQEGHIEVLKLLLSHGVDVDAIDMLRMTPLHWAAEYGHEECVRLLLEHGADPCAINKFDKTPDQIAYNNSRMDITQLIQEYAESPLRMVRRKEAKERQKKFAAAHKAAVEAEKQTRQQGSRVIVANPKEQREVRIVKLPQRKVGSPQQAAPVKVGYESGVGLVNNKTSPIIKVNRAPILDNSTEKTLEMLRAHGITMLPNDEGTIVASAVQSGQKVVLTEAGKMALTLTEQPSLNRKVIKLPPELLRGKKLIKISPEDLVKMRNEKRVIITTEKTLKPSIFVNNAVVAADKSQVNVVVTKTVVNNQPQLTTSVTVPRVEETEVERLRRELEETRRQLRQLQEQFRKKEQEVEEYRTLLTIMKK